MKGLQVRAEKLAQLQRDMDAVGAQEMDLEESFILGTGPGGQKVNKTSVCVRLVHRPSGTIIKCAKTRSRALNRYYARVLLCERLDEQIRGAASRRQQAQEKIRRQKRRRSRRQREKVLAEKHRQSERKAGRKPVNPHEE